MDAPDARPEFSRGATFEAKETMVALVTAAIFKI